jgi:CRISPR/Cas system-associated exonuclease Cas4 (RecB family)
MRKVSILRRDSLKFEHAKEIPALKQIKSRDLKSGRVYVIGKNRYPSITTVLSILSEEAIEKWRKRVGDREADHISKMASESGSELHLMLEQYVDGQSPVTKDFRTLDLYLQIQKELDKHLGKVYYQEAGLYSDVIKIAGRTDLIAEWDSKLSIIDYKSSKRTKSLDDIEHYFIQACFYSMALEEQTGLKARQLVIVIGNDDNASASVFVQDRRDYIKKLVDVKRYWDKQKI